MIKERNRCLNASVASTTSQATPVALTIRTSAYTLSTRMTKNQARELAIELMDMAESEPVR